MGGKYFYVLLNRVNNLAHVQCNLYIYYYMAGLKPKKTTIF